MIVLRGPNGWLRALFALMLAVGFTLPLQAQAQSLWVWQQRIAWQFDVAQLPPSQMQDLLATAPKDNLLVFDVREPSEYAVSHLEGAIQVDPNATPDAFMAKFGDRLRGKTLVFYCSIGWRSSELADRLAPKLDGLGTGARYNLRGGIFRWHNEQRPLMNASGGTDWVHPYSPDWANLVVRQGRTSYQPR